MEARRRQSVQQTAPTNHKCLGGGFCTTSVERCQHCNHLQERRSTDCGNYRGISLLSIAGKILARILLNRLSTHIPPEVLPETQCGFRGRRSIVDMIFCLRQLQEKCIEQDRPLYMVFVDFSKAFDTVGRTELWQLMRKYGCPEKFPTIIEALLTGMMAKVSVRGEVSESLSVTNGSPSYMEARPGQCTDDR
ncbi:hypothetical protein NP493_1657g00052 [Ridgeia piscesae]|uniref:Reverse transcriptase domain-containing protein n=1 Tax=Ridgeia piscesae TaxID=27915 RepID=A0AAD9JX35_RIDPI|nr:hypothetical protein NP493_1657g00052 [Ridgeia piscesae]